MFVLLKKHEHEQKRERKKLLKLLVFLFLEKSLPDVAPAANTFYVYIEVKEKCNRMPSK